MRSLLLLAGLALLPHAALAQDWKTDPKAIRLAWGNANVVLRPDTVHGLQIWANTSRVLDHSVPRRSFATRFQPEAVIEWLAYARQLVVAKDPPRDPKSRLQTPPLRAMDGSMIYLAREQKKGKWASNISVVFAPESAVSSWGVLTQKSGTEDFLKGLFQTASASFYQPDIKLAVFEPNPFDTLTCPRPLQQPSLVYPANRQFSGHSGDVWLTFVVRADSTIDRESMTVLISDGEEFTASAVRAVTGVRYQPATHHGQLVDALAFQRVSFLVRK